MKTRIKLIIATLMLMSALTCGAIPPPAQTFEPPLAGGYAVRPVTDEQVIAAARYALEAEKAALRVRREPAELRLIGIEEAASQVVAGVNYRLRLKVDRNGREQIADAVVWWQAWRKPRPYRLTEWTWQ